MKKSFLALAMLIGLGTWAQQQDTIRVTVNGQQIIILTDDISKVSETDYNAIIKKMTEETQAILARQKADMARIDAQLKNGEIDEATATQKRAEVNKNTEDSLTKLSESIEAWANKTPKSENSEDVNEWVNQWEENAETYTPEEVVVAEKDSAVKKGTTVYIDEDGIRVENNDDNWLPKKKEKTVQPRTVSQFELDWGWNNWFSNEALVTTDNGELRGWNSAVFGFGWAGKTRIGSANSKMYVRYGGQFNWNNLRLRGSNVLVKSDNPDGLSIVEMGNSNYQKSRLRMVYFDVPLMFQFDSSKNGVDDGFTLGVGAYGGVRLSASTRTKYDDFNGDHVKNVQWNNFYTNAFRYGVVGQIGFGNFKITGKYDLSTLFRQDKTTPNYQIGSIAFGFAFAD